MFIELVLNEKLDLEENMMSDTAKVIGHLFDICDLLDKHPEMFEKLEDGNIGIQVADRYSFTISQITLRGKGN